MKNSMKLFAGGLVLILVASVFFILGSQSGEDLTGKLELKKKTRSVEVVGSKKAPVNARSVEVIGSTKTPVNAPPMTVNARSTVDPFNQDSDGDGLSNSLELCMSIDDFQSDYDGDGSTFGMEDGYFGTNPCNSDTDGDGYNDGWELKSVGESQAVELLCL